MWYRAQLVGVEEGKYTVKFIDYDNEDILQLEDLVDSVANIPVEERDLLDQFVEGSGEDVEDLEEKCPLKFSVGQSCLARWSEDLVWYRARVEEGRVGGYTVTFTDYGNKDYVEFSHILETIKEIPVDQLGMLDQFVEECEKEQDSSSTPEELSSYNVKKKVKRSQGKNYKNFLIMAEKYKYALKTCTNTNCKRKALLKDPECRHCSTKLPLPESYKKGKMLIDVERTSGDMDARPLSLGLVYLDDTGARIKEQEWFLLPPKPLTKFIQNFLKMQVSGGKLLSCDKKDKIFSCFGLY